MSTLTIYAAATAASDGTTIPHPVYDSRAVESFTVIADNLGGGEEVDIYILAGATYIVAKDLNGVAYKLAGTSGSNNSPMLVLEGGPAYQFRKDLTGGACGIYVIEGRGVTA